MKTKSKLEIIQEFTDIINSGVLLNFLDKQIVCTKDVLMLSQEDFHADCMCSEIDAILHKHAVDGQITLNCYIAEYYSFDLMFHEPDVYDEFIKSYRVV